MTATKVVCWDLDETLGSYDRIKAELAGDPIEDADPSVMRSGLEDALQRLSAQGYSHYITSLGTKRSADIILKRSGFTKYFSGVIGGEDTNTQKTKSYTAAAAMAGIPINEAPARMIVIGDSPMDKPCDLEGVVFVQQRNGYQTSAAVVESILSVLNVLGSGKMDAGFQKMYALSKPKKIQMKEISFDHHIFSLFNGIELELSYDNAPFPDENDLKRPIIFVRAAEGYQKEPVEF